MEAEWRRCGLGWHGQALPLGLSAATTRQQYLWALPNSKPLEMVYVPPGAVIVGSEAVDAHFNEKPQHTRSIGYGYWISTYPTTWLHYREFESATARTHRLPGARLDHPVTTVSWLEAIAFCSWAGVTLPTEPEWERAARGSDDRLFPWGNDPATSKHCHCALTRRPRGPAAVTGRGGGPARPLGRSPYGAFDMAGNVYSWCAERYDEAAYAKSGPKLRSTIDLLGLDDPRADSVERPIRGGGYSHPASECRSSRRNSAAASFTAPNIGFRCVLVDPSVAARLHS